MSTIVAIRKGAKAAIAGELQTSQGDTVVPGEMRLFPRKIHFINGAYVGVVGNIAHHHVLRSLLASKSELFDFSTGEAIFETLRNLHPILKEQYYLLTCDGEQAQEYESNQLTGLVVSRAGVFSFFGYREVSEYKTFWAAGSGMEYALGALEASYATEASPKHLAELAVTSACRFDPWSGPPIESYEVNLEG